MALFKFYDAYCDECGGWYGSNFKPPQVANLNEAISEMKKHGWQVKGEKTFCETCSLATNEKEGSR